MNDFEVLNKLVDTNWTDRDYAYELFLSYVRNRPDLTGEQIIRNIEKFVPQSYTEETV